MLEIGTKAPAISLPDQNGTIHTLNILVRRLFYIFTQKTIPRDVRNRHVDLRRGIRSLWKKGLWC